MSSPKMQCGHSILSGELVVTVPAVEVSVSLQPSSPLLFCHYCFCLLRADALLFTWQFATLLWLAYQPLLVAMDEVGVLFTGLETCASVTRKTSDLTTDDLTRLSSATSPHRRCGSGRSEEVVTLTAEI